MTWTNFFRSRAFKYGSLSGGVVLAGGAAASTALAFKIASFCSAVATGFINEVGTGFTIAELDAVVHYEQYNLSIVLDNIYADLPDNWLHVVHHAEDLPAFCFAVPLILGLTMSTLAAMALANTVGIVMFIRDHGSIPLSLQIQTRDNDLSDDEGDLFTPS